MARIAQSLLIGGASLCLGYFLGQQNSTPVSTKEISPKCETPTAMASSPVPTFSPESALSSSPPEIKEWDLSASTDEERKSKCLEALDAFHVPLLPAPELDSKLRRPFVTNFEGEILLRWKPVPKAKNYVISVENEEGAVVKTYRTTNTSIYLKYLPRDKKEDVQYFFRLATQNLNDLIGVPGSKYELTVKKPLDLTAPKIEEIRIEN